MALCKRSWLSAGWLEGCVAITMTWGWWMAVSDRWRHPNMNAVSVQVCVCCTSSTWCDWQTDTPLEFWLPVTSQIGCHGYHLVLRHCAVWAEAEKTLLTAERRCSGRRVGCDCRRAECDSLVCHKNKDKGDEETWSNAWILRQPVEYTAGKCGHVCVRACVCVCVSCRLHANFRCRVFKRLESVSWTGVSTWS